MKRLLVLFLIIASVSAQSQESVLLRLNYNKGDNYIINMKISQEMGTIMTNDMNFEMSQKITEINEDIYDSELKIQKISMKVSQGGVNIDYDSTTKEEDLDASGKIMKTQMDPMLNALIKVKSNSLGEEIETKVEPSVKGLEEMSNQSSSVVYPKEAVSVGSSWNATKTEKGMDFKFTYTVKSITSKLVTLDISGTVGGLAEGTISGKMNIDKNTGVPNSSKIDMDMTVSGQKLTTNLLATMKKI